MTTIARPITAIRRYTEGWNRPMLVLTGLMAVTGLISLVGLVVDDRMLTGQPIWAKPLKFSLSIALFAVTWAWMTSLTTKAPRTVRWTSAGIVVLLVVEMGLIMGQMLRGKASHFNNETPLDSTLFQVMGVVIGSVWVLTLVLTAVLMRTGIADAANRWAIRLGAAISLVGALVGPLMTGPTADQLAKLENDIESAAIGAHTVGAPDGGPGIPILGWSTTGGDLRIPHFVGLHALQLLPLLAVVLGLLAVRWQVLRAERVRARLVVVAAAGYLGLVGLFLWQAFRGQSIIAPDGLTLAAFGLLVALVAAGAAWALRTAPAAEKEKVAV